MKIGNMSTLVVFEHKTRERDDLLKLPDTWEEYDAAWCGVEVEAGGESGTDRQTEATNTWRLTCHWSERMAGVTPMMRARVGERVLGIRSVIEEFTGNQQIIILCGETT